MTPDQIRELIAEARKELNKPVTDLFLVDALLDKLADTLESTLTRLEAAERLIDAYETPGEPTDEQLKVWEEWRRIKGGDGE